MSGPGVKQNYFRDFFNAPSQEETFEAPRGPPGRHAGSLSPHHQMLDGLHTLPDEDAEACWHRDGVARRDVRSSVPRYIKRKSERA